MFSKSATVKAESPRACTDCSTSRISVRNLLCISGCRANSRSVQLRLFAVVSCPANMSVLKPESAFTDGQKFEQKLSQRARTSSERSFLRRWAVFWHFQKHSPWLSEGQRKIHKQGRMIRTKKWENISTAFTLYESLRFQINKWFGDAVCNLRRITGMGKPFARCMISEALQKPYWHVFGNGLNENRAFRWRPQCVGARNKRHDRFRKIESRDDRDKRTEDWSTLCWEDYRHVP